MNARIPYCTKIRYGISGAPILTEDEMDGSHAPGISVAPTLIELVYSTARDGKPASVAASVTGDWTRFGERADGQMTVHFKNGPDGWPAWLAEEARLHDPNVAPANQVADFTAADLVAALRGAGAERDKIEAQARATYRATLYRELADQQTQLAIADDLDRHSSMATARRQLVKELRRMATEARPADMVGQSSNASAHYRRDDGLEG